MRSEEFTNHPDTAQALPHDQDSPTHASMRMQSDSPMLTGRCVDVRRRVTIRCDDMTTLSTGECNGEGRSATRLALNRNLPGVLRHNMGANRKPQAGSLWLGGIKWLKQMRKMLV